MDQKCQAGGLYFYKLMRIGRFGPMQNDANPPFTLLTLASHRIKPSAAKT